MTYSIKERLKDITIIIIFYSIMGFIVFGSLYMVIDAIVVNGFIEMLPIFGVVVSLAALGFFILSRPCGGF